jgi:hypothetical protein
MSSPPREAATLAPGSRECQPSPPAAARTDRGRRAERVLSVALFFIAVAWVVRYPRALGESDEALYLYEAARLLHGDLFYRDLFEIITPASHYLMALFFMLFGTTFATARFATALVHGGIVLLVYRGSRALGARAGLAAAAAAAHLAVDFPAWPYASPHWLGTLLTLAVVVILLAHPRPGRRATLASGVLLGLLLAVQQQKAPAVGAGIAAVLLLQHAVDRRGGTFWRPLLGQLLLVGLGFALVAVPLVAFLVVSAGVQAPFDALVRHTLYYRSVARIRWGGIGYWNKLEAANSFPRLLATAPIVLALVAALRVAAAASGPTGLRRTRNLLTVVTFLVFGAASILYFPDFIHLAFIAPIAWMLAAETVEFALASALPARLGRVAGGVVTAAVLLAVGVHLGAVLERARTTHPFPHETPFGRVDFRKQGLIDFVERTRARLAEAGTDEIYTHPGYTSLYLLTGTRNPTRFQMAAPGYNPPEELDEIIAVLARKQLPYLIVIPALAKKDDPVVQWILEHYELHGEPDFTVGPVLLARKATPRATPP